VSKGRSGLVIAAAGGALLVAAGVYLLLAPSAPPPSRLSSEASVPPPVRPSVAPPSATPPMATTRSASPSVGSPAPHAAANLARLRIDADVPGASVFFDHRYLGRVPVEVRDVAPGAHRLNVSAAGQEMYAETLQVDPGSRDVMVRFKQVRLDEALDVVHRHGIGSCQGRLSATEAGVRYETGHREDAFVRPLAELEPLELDYAKKNLRVRVRGGKTYNFTTRDGNADGLLRFQQKVEAARKHL
jgi:PEGA domain